MKRTSKRSINRDRFTIVERFKKGAVRFCVLKEQVNVFAIQKPLAPLMAGIFAPDGRKKYEREIKDLLIVLISKM